MAKCHDKQMKIKNASENTDAGATIAAVPLCFIKTLRSENSEAAYTTLQDNGCLRCAYFANDRLQHTACKRNLGQRLTTVSHQADGSLHAFVCLTYFCSSAFMNNYASIVARKKTFVKFFCKKILRCGARSALRIFFLLYSKEMT